MKKGHFELIRKKVLEIPAGKVATYGQIANLVGIKDARIVGWAMHSNPDSSKTPCHKVVAADGSVAENYAFEGWKQQKQRLSEEGVTFNGKW